MVARRLLLIASLALGGCTFPEEPLPPGVRKLVVHAVLNPGIRVQVIQLSTTSGYDYTDADLAGSSVTITAPDGTVMTAKRDSIYAGNYQFYYGRSFSIDLATFGVNLVPGGTYQLRVVTPRDTVTGSTTLPQANAVVTQPPATTFRRETDTVHVTWSAVPGASTYEVQFWAVYDANSRFRTHSVFAKSAVSFAGTARSLDDRDIFPVQLPMNVVVLAVDVNYYEYYRLLADPFIGAPPSRLTGGIGVFGSVVPISLRRLNVQ
jgi:hypothetical protein